MKESPLLYIGVEIPYLSPLDAWGLNSDNQMELVIGVCFGMWPQGMYGHVREASSYIGVGITYVSPLEA